MYEVTQTKTEFTVKELQTDVCVVGGGMPGLCAALAAARNGAKVVLIQDRPVLGGNASSEVRMWICGAHGADNKEAGILEEIMLENYYRNPGLKYALWDDILYGKCVDEDNLTLLLSCSVNDLVMDPSTGSGQVRRIKRVKAWHLTEQCYYEVSAQLFADCSGDSVLRVSGAEFRVGRESRREFDESHAPEVADDKTMGHSLLMQLRKVDEHVPFVPPSWAHKYRDEDLPNRPVRAIADASSTDNFWWLEFGGLLDTIEDADQIRDECYRIAYGVWDLIKNHPDGRGHGWELDWIGSLPGKRENVRYVGDHILTQNDVEAEGRFDDIVAYGGWSMDDHHPEAIAYPGSPTIFHPAPSPYGIPYRCLYSKNVENLLFAGRNISATHMAMSSTRVMATCALMGQAVGTAAAVAVRHGLSPRRVGKERIDEVQSMLLDQDCYLPWRTRETTDAELSASSGDPVALSNGIDRSLGEADNGWWGGEGDALQYELGDEKKVTGIRLVLDSDFGDVKRMPCRFVKDGSLVAMPAMLLRDFRIEAKNAEGAFETVLAVSDNWRRYAALKVDVSTSCIRLTLGRSWGGSKAHIFGFDVKS